jgi:hypothetical protein
MTERWLPAGWSHIGDDLYRYNGEEFHITGMEKVAARFEVEAVFLYARLKRREQLLRRVELLKD